MCARTRGTSPADDVRFRTLRVLDVHGGRHAVVAGTRALGAGRHAVLVQPLVSGGSIIGRHGNDHDPITGLLTRWALARRFESLARRGAEGVGPVILVLKLENFSAISEYIGHEATDVVLVRVASALGRLMGDTFLACLPEGGGDAAVRVANRVIREVNTIDVPGFSATFQLRASVGIAVVSRHDFDFAMRLADVAVNAACAAGGNRALVGTVPLTTEAAGELSAAMDLGSWAVWLQPVLGRDGERVAFYEALARFCNGHGHVIARPEFFVAGRAQGLLERFDLGMLQRVLQLLAAHPEATISINVSFESFMAEDFPRSFLGPIRAVADGGRRIILEIAPHCLGMPAEVVHPRLESLAAAGVAVAVDDFGSGLCRLQDLTQYPLAIVKLDELVTGYVDDDPLQREFVRTVASLCRVRGRGARGAGGRGGEGMTRVAGVAHAGARRHRRVESRARTAARQKSRATSTPARKGNTVR